MHEFRDYIFLDPPKTGTSFVSAFLQEWDPTEVVFYKHKRARHEPVSAGKFLFTTIRNPFDFYRSTYKYAFRKDGGGRKSMYAYYGKSEIENLFTGRQVDFEKWLRLFLDLHEAEPPEFVPTPGWGSIGRYTYRHMKLALRRGAGARPTLEAVRSKYATMLPHAYLRTNSLSVDLANLVTGPLAPAFENPEKAAFACVQSSHVNASPLPGAIELSFPKWAKQYIYDRECLMFEIWDSLREDPGTGIVTSNLQGP